LVISVAVGVILIGTAAISFCPIYAALGLEQASPGGADMSAFPFEVDPELVPEVVPFFDAAWERLRQVNSRSVEVG
jgi:hypothetical protein